MKHKSHVTTTTGASTSFLVRCARRKLLLVYFVIGAYIVSMALWWFFVRGDVLPLESSNWLALHGKRLIRTPRIAAGGDGDAAVATGGLAVAAADAVEVAENAAEVAENAVEVAENANAVIALEPELSCLGWRQTGGCDPNGPHEPNNDVACNKSVLSGASGYCALRDERTGLEVRAMELSCNSVRENEAIQCDEAIAFAKFKAAVNTMAIQATQAQAKQAAQVQQAQSNKNATNGIIMVMYPKLLVSVHATIRMLRSHNCTLPVELWFLETEMDLYTIKKNPILASLTKNYGPVTFHGIKEAQIKGFNSKVYAIAYTDLDNVLFLDADNVPVKDPTYLFESPEFKETGAIFWPDFWHPINTIFNIHERSLLWELAATPFVDMMEQESGQLLINRAKSSAALQILQLYAFHAPSLFARFRLAWGDKDLFRLAWLKTNTSFHFIPHAPGAAGRTNVHGVFCGMTMVQFDPQGDVLFLHRNAKKLTGDKATAATPQGDQTLVWRQLQTFTYRKEDDKNATAMTTAERYAAIKQHFHVGIYGGGNEFPETGMCYGEKREVKTGFFKTVDWTTLPYWDLEPTLIRFAQDAVELQSSSTKS